MSWTRCLDAVQRVEDKLWKSGKARKPWDYQKVTQSLPPPPPYLQSCYELPVEPGGEHHESRFVLFPWKKTGCQELWSLWDGESSKKSVPGELYGRRNSAFPASFGLSVLFWEFGPQSLTAVLLEGSIECGGGQVGGGGSWVSAQTYTTRHGCPGLPREGHPCAATPGNSQRGRVHRHACRNKQRWKRLAVLIFHPDSFFLQRLHGSSVVGMINCAELHLKCLHILKPFHACLYSKNNQFPSN